MKQSDSLLAIIVMFLVFFLLILNNSVAAQEPARSSAPLPDNINKIVSVSCMPCHSSNGGMLSKAKLNFSEWTDYPADKQKKKAEQMYKELKKDKMPPKSAREANPDIIPTREQINIIKSWANSF